MHSENNELAKAGHELAKCLDSNTPLTEIAKLIARLATALDVTTLAVRESTKQRDALAAENAALKAALEWLYEAVSMPDSGPIPDKYYSSVTNAAAVMYETPATDAFMREQQAQGVELAVDVVKQCYDNICAGGLQENREYEESIVQPHLDGIDDELNEIIAQLRKGGAA